MNGRVYDPALGRFLSADPIIGSPDLLQDYNRYAYVRNNPLRFTDPTGECIECFVAIIAIGMIAEGNKYWKTVGTVALAWALGGSNGLVESGMGVPAKMTTAAGAVIGNPANSFIAGFITGTVASGGDLGAGIQSGVTAAAFTAVGGSEAFGTVERVIAHAVIGCMQSAISGSDCGPGALSAAFGKIATGAIEGLKLDWPVEGALAAIAGGTASVLGGGKFVNGALTAGFGYLFNHMTGRQLARLAAKGSQLLTDFLIDAGAEKIHDNVHMRAGGVHAIADGVFKFGDVDHFHAAEVKIGDGDYTKNQRIVYRALQSGQDIEMWGTGADKIAARLGLTPNEAGVYKVPAGRLQIEAFSFTRDGQFNQSRSQILNDALRKGVNGRGGLD
jgi:hypothetical protein